MSLESSTFILFESVTQHSLQSIDISEAYIQYNGNEEVLNILSKLCDITRVNAINCDNPGYTLHTNDIMTYKNVMEMCQPRLKTVNRSGLERMCMITPKIVIYPGIIDSSFLNMAAKEHFKDESKIDSLESLEEDIINDILNENFAQLFPITTHKDFEDLLEEDELDE
jgi:hypothetical protein